jgi:hypothetical protein
MPRTIEHIVGCHEAAQALRKAGKPIWKKQIDVLSIIHEDQQNESPEHICAISNRIARLIRNKAPASHFDVFHDYFDSDFVDAVESMESCTIKELAVDKANGVEAVDIFNGWLESIYDWADVNRIWLGRVDNDAQSVLHSKEH